MAQPELIKDIEARVIRPTSTDNAIVRFNGATGQIQNTANTIDDSNNTIINGNITINGSITDTPLQIKSKSDSTWIDFLNNSGIRLGYLGLNSTGPAFYKSTTFPILHSGNYYNYALPLTGGTLTGQLIIESTINNSWNEGVRINTAANGWTTLILGCSKGYTAGTQEGAWSLHTYNGTFYLSHNGSSSGNPMLIGIKNTGFKIQGTLEVTELITGTISNADTVDGYHASSLWRSDGGTWNGNANLVCSGSNTEWSIDVSDGGTNSSYFHIWSGNLGNSMIQCWPTTGRVLIPYTLGIGGYNTNYKLYVNGNSYFYGKIWSKQMIIDESTTTGGIYWGITYDDVDDRAESGITTIRGSGSSIGFAVNCSYTDEEGENIMGKRCWYKNAANNYCYNHGYTITPSALMLEGDGLLYHYQGETKVYAQNTEVIMTKRRIWRAGDSVTGAVWNDYAECREADTIEPGYVLVETGDDSLTKSTERLSPFAGVSSDTWGFSQGETDKAKTPIAVAGRVLVYPWQDRNNYKPGDCVCAAPEGKVDIMTREEIVQYPDRIVGTVSSVPTYNKWGGGEKADREPIDVNGRIWIKVK